MENENITWNQLARYEAGESSPAEKHAVQQWIHANEEHEVFVKYLRRVWEQPLEKKQDWDVEAAWQRFQAEYPTENEGHPEENKSTNTREGSKGLGRTVTMVGQDGYIKKHKLVQWGSVAAAIGVIIVMVFLIYEPPAGTNRQPEIKVFSTENGQRLHLRLSDGSRVVLNAGSSMRVPETFSGDERKVELSGEAYFEVAPDPQKPFKVYTEQAVTRVLGTKFDVKAYADNAPVQVVVIEGKVELRSADTSFPSGREISELQKGILDSSGTTISHIKDIASYVGWTKGKLVFQDNSIEEVATRLERWYGINVQITKLSSRDLRFTGSFTIKQPLEEVLEAIALSLNMTYSRSDSTIIFNNAKK